MTTAHRTATTAAAHPVTRRHRRCPQRPPATAVGKSIASRPPDPAAVYSRQDKSIVPPTPRHHRRVPRR